MPFRTNLNEFTEQLKMTTVFVLRMYVSPECIVLFDPKK